MAKQAESVEDRIRRSVTVRPNGCWLWNKSKTDGEYGQMWVGSRSDGSRRKMLAHVVSYLAFRGPIPDGLEMDHLCHTPACVNPNHLEAVTRQVNMERAHIHQRRKRVARASYVRKAATR